MSTKDEPQLRVRVMAPTQTLYNGPALSVSANNKIGAFDVLADHANFFSLITEGNITINTGYQLIAFPAQRGIIKVTNNDVALFVDIDSTYAQ
jgi:F0F1-type ATP synthase epsilon subunit